MPFSQFEPTTTAILRRVYDAAMLELANSPAVSPARIADTKALVTKQLLAAAAADERDPRWLKRFALEGIDRAQVQTDLLPADDAVASEEADAEPLPAAGTAPLTD